MKIAFYDTKPYDQKSFEEIKKPNIDITYFETKLNRDTVTLCRGYDAVCVFVNDDLSKDVVDKLYEYGVKAIFLRCAGYNNIDLKSVFGKLHVFRVPAYSPYAVAEHTMALLLTSNRRIHKAYNRTREYNFSLNGFTGYDLFGKTVGIIGMGKIGKIFANICKGFGMKILAYDKFPYSEDGIQFVNLEELFKQSDIISLHCPLTQETKYIINENSIELMKKGVHIINTSRGALIDTAALLKGIKDRKIGAASLDVYEEESDFFFEDKSGHIMDDENLLALLAMPNVIITSHQAFLTKEALDNIAEITISNIENFFSGKDNINNEVCYHCENENECPKRKLGKCF